MTELPQRRDKPTAQRRPISANERLFLALDRVYPPFVNQFVLEGTGSIDAEELSRAVNLASLANPGSRLKIKGHLCMARFIDSGINPPVSTIAASQWSGYDQANADFLVKPLDLSAGPCCEVILLPATTSNTLENTRSPVRLIFRSHHATMDGGGTLHWVRDVFNALNNRPLLGSGLGVTDLQVASSLKPETGIDWQKIYPPPTGHSMGTECGLIWQRLHIKHPVPQLLAKVAVFIARQARGNTQQSIDIAIPVDMRKHCSLSANTGNLTGFIHVLVSPQTTVDNITQQIRNKLAQREFAAFSPALSLCSYLPLALLKSGLQKDTDTMCKNGLFGSSAVLSNLGKLDLSDFSVRGFAPGSGFFIPPGSGASPCFMALSGSESGIDLITSMTANFASQGRLSKLMAELETYLQISSGA